MKCSVTRDLCDLIVYRSCSERPIIHSLKDFFISNVNSGVDDTGSVPTVCYNKHR